MANRSRKANTIPEAFLQALLEKVSENKEFQDAINVLTGIVLEEAEKFRGNDDDDGFHDAFHCDVNNEIVRGVDNAVKLVVDNWDEP